ncbi:membrane protein [Neisseria arctica]|uniref:Membrane protein n=1 Tax=Neisseria arctica TaxID=1470200 RepID=A0A0J0YSZ3_9NEIS|nr:membrane protein [Neisseria arctica]
MSSPYFFGILILIYIIVAILNFIISYKIFKEEGEISGFFDFLIKFSHLNFKYFKILFGKKEISNKFNLLLLRINLIFGVIILILLVINIFWST